MQPYGRYCFGGPYFFHLTVLAFLIISYRQKTFKAFKDSGLPGFIGGIILSFGFCGYVFAMYNTTVANTNFIISLQILFLAIFGYFFLKEKISADYFNFNYSCYDWSIINGW